MLIARWLRRKIGHRIFAGFALVAILTSLVAIISIVYLRGVGEDLNRTSGRLRVLQTEAMELRLTVEQESDSIRGYLLTGENSFLTATAAATERYAATLLELRGLSLGHGAELLDEVDKLHSDFLAFAAQQTNLHDQGFPATAVFLWQTQGNQVKDMLDERLAGLIAQRGSEIADNARAASQAQDRALAGALGVVGLTWLTAILLGVLISRGITRPVGELVSAAERMREGKTGSRAPALGDDELGTLGGAFNRMAQGIEDSRATADLLYKRERRRADQMGAINDVGRQMSSILSLDELLPYVANLLQRTFDYSVVNVFLLDPERNSLVLKAGAGEYEGDLPHGAVVPLGSKGVVPWAAENGRTLLVPDAEKEPRYLLVEEMRKTQSELAVPVKLKDKVVGVLDLQSNRRNAFDEADQFIAETLSGQLAVAIENARLYEQAAELATVQERQRLARELHDAVTQTLFSASVIADVLPRLWKKNPVEGERRLEELGHLTRGALAEMRMLLLELRPSALTEVGLGPLLKHVADAAAGRARIKVALTVEEKCAIPAAVQMAFYRVAQEAVNNIVKHAGASEAAVRLSSRDNIAHLFVSDNGSGFDPSMVTADHLGLRIMRERADALGARLSIESAIGHGTVVSLRWPGDAVE